MGKNFAKTVRGPGWVQRGDLVVLSVALLVRLLYLWELRSSPLLGVLVGDGRQYHVWAMEIAAGQWFGHEVFYQAPLYPYFLAGIALLFGPGLWSVRIVQILLGSVACLSLCKAGRAFFGPRVGLTAGLLLAVYPPAIFFDGLIQKTCLGLFLTCLLLLLLGRLTSRVTGARLVLAGLVLGALSLTRENALALAPLLLVWVLLPSGGVRWRTRLRRGTLLVAGLSAALLPVGLRNWAIGGEFLVTTSQLGPNFYIGNSLRADGRYTSLRETREDARVERADARGLAEADLGRPLGPAEVSDYWLRRSFDEIAQDRTRWFQLMLRKVLLLWNAREAVDTVSIEVYQDHCRLLRVLGWLLHFGIVLPLAILGVVATRHEWRRLWILHAVGLVVAASVVVFYVLARYRFPLVPLAMMFAAAGLLELVRRVAARQPGPLFRSLAILVVVGLAANWPLEARTSPRATTYYNLGVAYLERGDDELAREFLGRALERLPHLAPAHARLGGILAGEGRLDEAVEHRAEVVRLAPEDADAHFALADVRLQLAQWGLAIEDYRRGLRLDPTRVQAHINLGHGLTQVGKLDEAAEHLRRALGVDPDHAKAHNLLGNVLAEQGNLGEAIRHYEEAVRLDGDLVDAHFKLGLLLGRGEHLDRARHHFERATRLAPGFSEGHRELARILERQGLLEEAARSHRRAQELDRREHDRNPE